jgi:hypothetical protein
MMAARAKQLRRNLMSIQRPAVPLPKIADAHAIEAVASPVHGGSAFGVASADSRGGPSPRRASTAGVGLSLAPFQRWPLT